MEQTEQTDEEEEVHEEVVEDEEQADGVEDLRKRRGTLGSVKGE